LLMQSEIAICPASTVAMEVCCARIGLLTGTVIDNQFHTHQQLLNGGCCVSVGDFNLASLNNIENQLSQLSDIKNINRIISNQMKAIDGFSGERILHEFKNLALA